MAKNSATDPSTAPTDTTSPAVTAPDPYSARPASPPSNGKTDLSDAFREHFSGDAALADKVKSFAKARPWAGAALAGIAAIAILNSLRGKRD